MGSYLPAILSGGVALNGPAEDGESGSGLVTDGNGQLSFVAIAALSHGHMIEDVEGLQAVLDGKAPVSHAHVIGDVADLQSALNGKAPSSTVSAASPLTLTAANASHVPLTVKGAASQTASLVEWQNNSGAVVAAVGPTGTISTSQVSSTESLTLYAPNQNSDHIAFSIGGISSTPCILRASRAHADVPTNGAALSTTNVGGAVALCGRSRTTGSGSNGDVTVAGGNCASAGNSSQAGTLTLRGGTHSNTALHGDIDVYWGGALVIALDVDGIHIGDSSTRKLGFYGATPVSRSSALTAADGTTIVDNSTAVQVINNVRLRLNELEARLRTMGLLS